MYIFQIQTFRHLAVREGKIRAKHYIFVKKQPHLHDHGAAGVDGGGGVVLLIGCLRQIRNGTPRIALSYLDKKKYTH